MLSIFQAKNPTEKNNYVFGSHENKMKPPSKQEMSRKNQSVNFDQNDI
jgi:hypothetical protein